MAYQRLIPGGPALHEDGTNEYVIPGWLAVNANVSSTQTLTPSLFTNSQTFYAPTVTASYTLSPTLFTNTQVFYSPTVTGGDSATGYFHLIQARRRGTR